MMSVGSENLQPDTKPNGETEEKPLVLYGDKAVDWEHFLAMLYHELVLSIKNEPNVNFLNLSHVAMMTVSLRHTRSATPA